MPQKSRQWDWVSETSCGLPRVEGEEIEKVGTAGAVPGREATPTVHLGTYSVASGEARRSQGQQGL